MSIERWKSALLMVPVMGPRCSIDDFLPAFPRQLTTSSSAGIGKKQHQHPQQQHSAATTCVPFRPARRDSEDNEDHLAVKSGGDEPVGEGDEDEIRDCVIVGAGIAGLAAAADLQRGGLDFVILEAADRLGGRIFTHKESRSQNLSQHSSCKEAVGSSSCSKRGIGHGISDRPLELGAQWLHGTVGNPLFDFCLEEGIFDSQEGRLELDVGKRSYTAGGFQARRPDGTLVSRREFLRHSEAWSQAVLEAEMLYATSLAEAASAEGGVAQQQEQQGQQQQYGQYASTRLEEKAVAATAAATAGAVAVPTAAAAATAATNRRQGDRAIGVAPNPDGKNDGGTHSISNAISTREDRVGAFLHRRVREILRAGVGGGGSAAPGIEGGGGGGDGGVDEGILGYLSRKQCAIEGCDDLNGVSVAGYGMYEELEGGDVRVPGGFSRVVDALAAKISPERIRLESPVTRVQWAAQEYEKSQEQEEQQVSSSSKRHPCVVEFTTRRPSAGGGDRGGQGQTEEVFTKRMICRRVLVTVGLGVLKDGTALAFSPPLPPAKLSAIHRLGFGTTDKIFVRCTTKTAAGGDRECPDPSLHVGVLRPIGKEVLGQHKNEQEQRRRERENRHQPPRWVDDIFSFAAEGAYVCSWLSGPSARAAEQAHQVEHESEAFLSLLRNATQDPSWQETPDQEELETSNGVPAELGEGETAGMPPPRLSSSLQAGSDTARPPAALLKSDWNSNPFFRGSYSYIATGSTPADMEELSRPLSAPVGLRAEGAGSVDRIDGEFGPHHGEGEGAEAAGEGGGSGSRPSARVFFAGEAMHARFFSTAHGGFETGQRAAREVLDSCGFKDASVALLDETTE